MKPLVMILIIGLLAASSVGAAKYFYRQTQTGQNLASPTPTSNGSLFGLVVHEEDLISIAVNEKTYRYKWEKLDPQNIVIGINTALASDSASIKQASDCKVLTSGGFYGKDNYPIGLLVNNRLELSPWQDNQLFNGVLAYTGSNLLINRSPDATFQWAVQAGPILRLNNQPAPLRLNRDQEARRIVAGVTSDNRLIVIAVLAADSLFSGPLLFDMPEVLSAIVESNPDLTIKDAINLDGGTASAFLTPTLQLKELQPVGSYLCSRE